MPVAYLKTIVAGRIVRCGNVDRTASAVMHSRKRNGWGGRGLIGQEDFEAVASQDLGHRSCEVLRSESFVIANDNRLGGVLCFFQKLCKTMGTASYCSKGVVLGDATSPTIGPEMYGFRGHWFSL